MTQRGPLKVCDVSEEHVTSISGSRIRSSMKQAESKARGCLLHARLLLGLFCNPEDEGGIFL
jgi:hypothetical protein